MIRFSGIKKSLLFYRLSIIIIGAILFIPFLDNVHLFDWDEINFAECAREMIESQNYLTVQIDYLPFWEKPPIFIWFQALSMLVFGVGEFAARFPNAICGIVSLLVMFEMGRKMYSVRFAMFWMMMYLASLLPFFYFKSGIIDPWFNLFIFISIFFLYKYFTLNSLKNVAFSAFFAGLAVMTKGPAAVVIIGLTLTFFILFKKFKIKFKWLHLLAFIFIFLLTGGFWFLIQILNGNTQTVIDFIVYQVRLFTTEDAGHGGFPFYHFVIIFFGAAPASILALPSLFKKNNHDNDKQKDFQLWMIILFWVVIILFSIVKTKIVHYSSLTYYPLTFLAARTLFYSDFKKMPFNNWKKVLLLFNFFILTLGISALPLIDLFKNEIIQSGLIGDNFALGNLQASPGWPIWIIYFNAICFALLILVLFKIKLQSDIYKVSAFSIIYILFNYVVMFYATPRIEAYSQNAAIEFIKEQKNKDVYVYPAGHKSFAHLFYAQKKCDNKNLPWDESLFLTGKANKPVYIFMKNTKANQYLEQYPLIEVLYQKNGFVFGKVNPVSETKNE